MRIQTRPDLNKSLRIIVLEHKGEELFFDLKGVNVNVDLAAMFRDLNGFWEWAGEDEHDAIFDIYKRIRNGLDILQSQTRFRVVFEAVRDLAPYHDPARCAYYAKHKRSKIHFPDDLKDEYNPGDKKEQTYLREEYYELTGLTIALKAMAVFWREYLNSDATLNRNLDNAKEIRCESLLQGSAIASSEAYKRLYRCVEFVVDQNRQQSSAGRIFGGMSTITLPDYVFAKIVVEKLTQTKITHYEDENNTPINLIANVFNSVSNIIKQLDTKKGNRLMNKSISSEDNEFDEDNQSVGERYKPKVDLAESRIAEFDYYSARWEKYAHLIKEDMDLDHVRRLIALHSRRSDFILTETQTKLIGVLCRNFIPKMSVPYNDREGVISQLSMAQVVCYEYGFSEIAELLGAYNTQVGNSALPPRSRTTEEQNAALKKLYPFQRYVRGKATGSKEQARNGAEIFIQAIIDDCWGVYWVPYSTPEIRETSSLIETNIQLNTDFGDYSTGYILPSNIRERLADFILQVIHAK